MTLERDGIEIVGNFQANRMAKELSKNLKDPVVARQQWDSIKNMLGAAVQANNIPPAQPTDPTIMRDVHKQLMKEMNQSIKVLEMQNEGDKLRKRIPPSFFEQYLYYFKKFKVLLKHAYTQMDKGSDVEAYKKTKELMGVIHAEAQSMHTFQSNEQYKKYWVMFK
jgi:hypothetical protein